MSNFGQAVQHGKRLLVSIIKMCLCFGKPIPGIMNKYEGAR